MSIIDGMGKRKHYLIPVAIAAMLAIVVFASLPDASDDAVNVSAAGDHNEGDIAVINAMIDNNGLGWPKAAADGDVTAAWMSTNWPGATWDAASKRITELNVSGKELTGSLNVSGLTVLKDLNCSQNKLTALNVSGLTALEKLNCSTNRLTALNVSGLTALKELNCSDNMLASLTLSGLPALEYMDCSSNNLTSLTVTGLPALKTLYCSDAAKGSLTVTGLPALEYMDCAHGSLTSLNLSDLPALEELVCYTNYLTSLDLSGLTALKEVRCSDNNLTSLTVSGLPALEILECSDNLLTELDVSGLPALKWLFCSYNMLTTLDVSGCTAVTRLDCSMNMLTTLDVSELKDLRDLECDGNYLTALDVSGLTKLYTLRCQRNLMTATSNVNLTGVTFPGWGSASGHRFIFDPQWRSVDITNDTKLTDIEAAIAAILAEPGNKFEPIVRGSKTNAADILVISRSIYWAAAYEGTSLMIKGSGIYLLKGASMTLTGLRIDDGGMDVYGSLTVNGNALLTDNSSMCARGGNILINGDLTFDGGGRLLSIRGMFTVTGNVTSDNNDPYSAVLNSEEAPGNFIIGGDLVTNGIAIKLDSGSVTVGGSVTAGGEYAIGARTSGERAVIHVKGDVSAPNGLLAVIEGRAAVIIDGTVTVKDDNEFIEYYHGHNIIPKSAAEENIGGYDLAFADDRWSVSIGKQAGGGDGGDPGGADPDTGGGGGGGNTLLIVAVAAAAVAAAVAAYLFVLRPRMK